MNKKILRCVCMAVVSALCVGIAAYAYPTPTYRLDSANTPVVMTINGDEIHANEFASYMLSAKNNFEAQLAQYGMDTSTVWQDSAMVDSVKQSAQSMITQYYMVLQQFAKEGLKLNKTDLDQIRTLKNNTIEQMGGKEGFAQALQSENLSEQMYDNSLLVSAYAQKLNNHYFGEGGILVPTAEEMLTYYNEHYYQAKHILLMTSNATTGEDISDEEKAVKKARAEDILAQLRDGADFDTLMNQYTEDTGVSSYPNGYIFTQGEMVDEFYNATTALAENEVSDIVQSDYGYHIIIRLPLDQSKVSDYKDALTSALSGKDFSTLLGEWTDAAAVEINDEELAKITIDNVAEIALTGITPSVTQTPTDTTATDDNTAATDDNTAATDENTTNTTPQDAATTDQAA